LGHVNIADVAAVAVGLLARDDTIGRYNLVQGDDCVDDAVEMCVTVGND
jgi:nucleoside-diphosphate-sugar epimerase